MGMRREDSVLVALGELRRIQEERRREEEEAERQKEEELRLEREAEARRLAEEEERWRREAAEALRRRVEEKARLDREERIRVQQEAARAEAEARVKADHELKLHLAALDAQRKRRVPWLAIGIAAVAVLAVLGWLVHVQSRQARMASQLAVQRTVDIQRAEQEQRRLLEELERKDRRLEELQQRPVAEPPKAQPAAGPAEKSARPTRRKGRPRATKKTPEPPKKTGITIRVDPHNPLGGLEPEKGNR